MVRDEQQYKYNYLKRGSDIFTGAVDKVFGMLGRNIGKFPWIYIFVSVLICGLLGLGMMDMITTTDPAKLWVPVGSNLISRKLWVEETFIKNTRRATVLAATDNILTPSGIKDLYALYDKLNDVLAPSGFGLSRICLKAGKNCIVESILELWAYNKTRINSLTQTEINTDLKVITHSPLFGHAIKPERILGGVTRIRGDIAGATSALMTFLLHDDYKKRVSVKEWEAAFIEAGQKPFEGFTKVYVISDRSYTDIDLTDGYAVFLFIGYFFVACFLVAVLGRVNLVEQRIYLSLSGLFGISMSLSIAYGIASMVGLEFGPLHIVLPFLFLAIGVDYMFIITRAFTDVGVTADGYDIVTKTGNILRYAGITLIATCFTHSLIFIICSTTMIPTIKSFCIFGAIGILGLSFMQAIFFTACFSLDIRRQEDKRNACFPCLKQSETYTPIRCEILPIIFKVISNIMSVRFIKAVILFITLVFLVINGYGFINLQQYFDTNWLFPSNSPAALFVEALATEFPNTDVRGFIYCGEMDYFRERKRFERLGKRLNMSALINRDFTDNWYSDMLEWFRDTTNPNVTLHLDVINKFPVREDIFVELVYRFVKFEQPHLQLNVIFDESLQKIKATRIPYMHPPVSSADKETDSLNAIADALAILKFNSSVCFPYSSEYLFWGASRVLHREMNLNMGYTFICVFIVTLFGIAHVVTTNIVLLCVICTMVDVAGTMHFMSLTIDPVTNVLLIMCVGIALDYSTHLGRLFMMNTGSREERVKNTLMEMGPAVLCGGVCLFLAVFPMAVSSSYLFRTTFKLFMMVAVYGTFHGLFFLPCMLTVFGPVAYNITEPRHPAKLIPPEPEAQAQEQEQEKEQEQEQEQGQEQEQEKEQEQPQAQKQSTVASSELIPPLRPDRSSRVDAIEVTEGENKEEEEVPEDTE